MERKGFGLIFFSLNRPVTKNQIPSTKINFIQVKKRRHGLESHFKMRPGLNVTITKMAVDIWCLVFGF